MSLRRRKYFRSHRIRPAVRCFEQAHLFQPEMVAVAILICFIEYPERGKRQILRCRGGVQHDRFVVAQRLEELQYLSVFRIDEECMVPLVNDCLVCDAFDF
jgi:hypothetical protein